MSIPRISIWITVWARFEDRIGYLRACITSLKQNLEIGDLEVKILLGCEIEDSPQQNLVNILAAEFDCWIIPHSGTPNLGANLNNLHREDTSEFVLYVQDDFVLNQRLDLPELVSLLESDSSIDMIRLTHRRQDQSTWLGFSASLSELGPLYPDFYSDNPHLRRRNWFEKFGFYDTRDNSLCEKNMNLKARNTPARILIRRENAFDHIGIYSSMVEKWAKHPRGWAAQLWVTPEEVRVLGPETQSSEELCHHVVKVIRENLPRVAFFGQMDRSWLIFQKYKEHLGFPVSVLFERDSGLLAHAQLLKENVVVRWADLDLVGVELIVLDLEAISDVQLLKGAAMSEALQKADKRSIWVIAGHLTSLTEARKALSGWGYLENCSTDRISEISKGRGILVVIPYQSPVNKVVPETSSKEKPMGKNLYGASIARLQKAHPPDYAVEWDKLPARMARQENFLKGRGLLEKIPKLRVLDIGPGIPFFPILMEELGHEVLCVETPEAPKEVEFQRRAGLTVRLHHILRGRFEPDDVKGEFNLINLTGIQFDLVDGKRWDSDYWVEMLRDLIRLAAPGATIYVARNWEILDNGEKVVSHYSAPQFTSFLDACSSIASYKIKREILEIRVVG